MTDCMADDTGSIFATGFFVGTNLDAEGIKSTAETTSSQYVMTR